MLSPKGELIGFPRIALTDSLMVRIHGEGQEEIRGFVMSGVNLKASQVSRPSESRSAAPNSGHEGHIRSTPVLGGCTHHL
jgi:hypothetical protein